MKRPNGKSAKAAGPSRVEWRGRPGIRISNGAIELTALNGGGHIAELRFTRDAGGPQANILWESPWEGAAPGTLRAKRLARKYGSRGVGEFLASYTGHALCLDYFGTPSADEVKQGFPLHGEAATQNWRVTHCAASSRVARTTWQVDLPSAGLALEREIELSKGESVAMFHESVTNQRNADHYFHWVQHVTLGAPLLDPECSRVFLSGTRAKSWPLGYEGKSLVSADREFSWPNAPREQGGTTDLSVPFSQRGTGFVASVLLDVNRTLQFVAALNWQLGLVCGYVFRTVDYPWVAVWEENCAREYEPWKGTTQARGMEFGTTPMPIGKEATFLAGKLFDKAGWKRIPPRATQKVVYAAFLVEVPQCWRSVQDIQVEKNTLVITGSGGGQNITVAARGISELQR